MNAENATETSTEEEQVSRSPMRISAAGIISDLHSGVTRLSIDRNYNPEIGSIQEKYNLTKKEVVELFQHPILKGLKTRVPKKQKFVLVDDVTTSDTTQTESHTTEEAAIETAKIDAISVDDSTEF